MASSSPADFITRIDGYAIDCVVSIVPELESDVTELPVEENSDVTDNIKRKPRRLKIDGIVTDTPNGAMIAERDQTQGDGVIASAAGRSWLVSIWQNETPVTVETYDETYRTMVLKNLSMPRDKDTGASLRFSAQFQELRVRATRRVVVAVARAQPANGLGNQVTKKQGHGSQDLLAPDEYFDDHGVLRHKVAVSPQVKSKAIDDFNRKNPPVNPFVKAHENLPWWLTVTP